MKKTLIMATVLAFIAGSASATLVTEYSVNVSFGLTTGGDIFTAQSASVGDVIAVASGHSKSWDKTYTVSSGDGGAVSAATDYFKDKSSGVSYWTVTTAGTFTLNASADTVGSYDEYGGFIIGSDVAGESVVEQANITQFQAPGFSAITNDYGTLASAAIVLEGFSHGGTGIATFDPKADAFYINGANSRGAVEYNNESAGAFSTIYGLDVLKNSRVAGVAFKAIPEPATLGMVAAMGGALLFIRRRMKSI